MTMRDTPYDDDQLLDALASAIEAAAPMPASVVELGRAAWDARALDAELAQLVADSLVDAASQDGERLAVRADSQPRLLSFAAGEIAIEVEVEVEASGAQRICGQILPAQPASVTLERTAGARHVDADASGRFELGGLTPGPARVRVQRALQRPLATAWFAL